MQIDSVKVHDMLNKIAFDASFDDLSIVNKIRRLLCDIEAETACERASVKSAGALEGLKEK